MQPPPVPWRVPCFLIIRLGGREEGPTVGVNYPTRWGVQPLDAVIAKKGFTYARLANEIGVNPTHLYNAGQGFTVPSAELGSPPCCVGDSALQVVRLKCVGAGVRQTRAQA